MGAPSPDSNVAFILTGAQRQQVIRSLGGFVSTMPGSSALLIDHAGRIVEEAQRPMGVNLPAVSALAAGCYATTHELARTMGQPEYSLLFQHESGQQVFIWPVADRALLVVLMTSIRHVQMLEARLAGPDGAELGAVISQAQGPAKHVPPPKIVLPVVPPEVMQVTKRLTNLIMDVQARVGGKFESEVGRHLLQSRDELIKALSAEDWNRAVNLCEGTRQWLARTFGLIVDAEPGKVLPHVYSEVFSRLHSAMLEVVKPDRLETLYRKFFAILKRKWGRVFVSDRCVSPEGIDPAALWRMATDSGADQAQIAPEYASGMDEMVREMLRVVYLAKGLEEREKMAVELCKELEKYKDWLLPLGLDGVVGRAWVPVGSAQ